MFDPTDTDMTLWSLFFFFFFVTSRTISLNFFFYLWYADFTVEKLSHVAFSTYIIPLWPHFSFIADGSSCYIWISPILNASFRGP